LLQLDLFKNILVSYNFKLSCQDGCFDAITKRIVLVFKMLIRSLTIQERKYICE